MCKSPYRSLLLFWLVFPMAETKHDILPQCGLDGGWCFRGSREAQAPLHHLEPQGGLSGGEGGLSLSPCLPACVRGGWLLLQSMS